MRDEIRSEVIAALIRTYGFKSNKEWLQGGKCPSCGKKEMFAPADKPFFIRCGRANNCGYEVKVKDLFPDIFRNVSERYPATTEDPDATARAYMEVVRGIPSTKTKDWYRQGTWRHPRGNRTVATVVFDLDRDKAIWMERFVDPVRVENDDGKGWEERRANFSGKYTGMMWTPPGQTLKKDDRLWLVEGCIDAITLTLYGLKAAATLSAYNFPATELDKLSRDVVLVWALDNDNAGRKYTKKHVAAARDMGFVCECAMVQSSGKGKEDWNDAHIAERLNDDFFDLCRHHGDLLLAKDQREKALLMYRRNKNRIMFAFEFERRTYWAKFFPEKAAQIEATDGISEEEAEEKTMAVRELANCSINFLYFQRDIMTGESWYYMRFLFPRCDDKGICDTFSGHQVTNSGEFKKRLASVAAGGHWQGAQAHMDWIYSHYAMPDKIKTVNAINFIGYSEEHKSYIFNDIAVHGGKTVEINDENYFEVGQFSVKSLNKSIKLNIGTTEQYRPEWADMLWHAFGPKGIVAAAFFLGSLFAEQIRDIHSSYPFLEIIGEPGSGKSTLIEFLWRLVGREGWEGIDPNKATQAALARILSQVSNLPVCFIESDREGAGQVRQFDWDEFKSAYNGRSPRSRGVKNNGNDTDEPKFRGTLMISQNNSVSASDAILQRIVHIRFFCGDHTAAGKAAVNAMKELPVQSVSHFIAMATMAEDRVMAEYKDYTDKYEKELRSVHDIRNNRIALNHAQIMAAVKSFANLTRMDEEREVQTLDFVCQIAKNRMEAIALDNEVVEEFWEVVAYLNGCVQVGVNHSVKDDVIALNLNHIHELAVSRGQKLPPMIELKRLLKTSRKYKFMKIAVVNSGLFNRSVRCWCFENRGGADGAL